MLHGKGYKSFPDLCHTSTLYHSQDEEQDTTDLNERLQWSTYLQGQHLRDAQVHQRHPVVHRG